MSHTFAIMEERNDIVIYQSEDGLVKMEAMVDPVNETIWASQKAIASLFACTKQNVSYHMGKIFASGELDRTAVVKEILTDTRLIPFKPPNLGFGPPLF